MSDDYQRFVNEMNERARAGKYDHEKPLFDLMRRARQGNRDAEAMLEAQKKLWNGELPKYTDEELGITIAPTE